MLYSFERPPGLVVHGFRDLLVLQMKGLPVAGWIQRRLDPTFGQAIMFRARGTREALDAMESDVLDGVAAGTDLKTPLWMWEMICQPTPIVKIGKSTFTILKNAAGAVKGEGSDPKGHFDNISLGSQGSHPEEGSGSHPELWALRPY